MAGLCAPLGHLNYTPLQCEWCNEEWLRLGLGISLNSFQMAATFPPHPLGTVLRVVVEELSKKRGGGMSSPKILSTSAMNVLDRWTL